MAVDSSCFLQGEAEEVAPLTALLHHQGVVPVLLLKGRCDRDDVHVPGGGECSLLKAQDDVVAKVSGRLIIHVFDKDSKGALVELSRPAALIAHLDSGLQNRLAELFADVPAAVESLGYGTDRDPQPVCDVFDCRS